jgi:hypothetical protein
MKAFGFQVQQAIASAGYLLGRNEGLEAEED